MYTWASQPKFYTSMSRKQPKINLEELIKEEDYPDTRSYQIAISSFMNSVMNQGKSLLAETAVKQEYNFNNIVTCVNEALQLLAQDPVSSAPENLFKEYDNVIDSKVFKEHIHIAITDHLYVLHKNMLTKKAYTSAKRSISSLRDLRNAMQGFKAMLILLNQVKELNNEHNGYSREYCELENQVIEKSRILNEIYEGYTADDESLAKYLAYKKHTKDGLTKTEICKILKISRPTLNKLLNVYELPDDSLDDLDQVLSKT